MPRHGLNQLLNSISVCLVLLTGLGIGAWFSQGGLRPNAPEVEDLDLVDEEVPRPQRRQTARRRPVRDSRIRQVAYQAANAAEEEGLAVPEPEESEDEVDPSPIPQRLAALPSPSFISGATIGVATSGVTFGPDYTVSTSLKPDPSLPGTARRSISSSTPATANATITFKITLESTFKPGGKTPASAKLTIVPRRPSDNDKLQSVSLEDSIKAPVNFVTSVATLTAKLPFAGNYQVGFVLYDLANGGGNVIFASAPDDAWAISQDPNAADGAADVRYIIQKPPAPAPSTDALVFRPDDQPMLLLSNDASLTVNLGNATPTRTYGLFYEGQAGAAPLVSLPAAADAAVVPQLTASLGQLPQPASYTMSVIDDWTGRKLAGAFPLRVPQVDQVRYPTPIARQFATGAFGDLKNLTGGELNEAKAVGDYLRLKGINLSPNAKLTGLFFTPVQPSLKPAPILTGTTSYYLYQRGTATVEQKALGSGNWEATFRFPLALADQKAAWLICIADDGTNFSVAKPIKVTFSNPDPLLTAPTIVGLNGTAANTFIGDPTAGFKTSSQTIVVNGNEKIPPNSQVTIIDVDTGAVLGSQPNDEEAASTNNWAVSVKLPATKAYKLVAQFTNDGGKKSNPSSQFTVLFHTSGPKVADYGPKNFGTILANQIFVQLDTPVGVSLTDTALLPLFKLYRNPTPNNQGTSVTISSAAYSASDNKVTLTIAAADVDAGPYKLVVLGTLTDAVGNKLRGDGTTSGKDAELKFGPPGLGGTEELDIPGPKRVPHVEFQEYTKSRKNPDEFLPSDHVETRVARLYYFRDAHRVAQIINREVESLNRAATTMQKQLADKARRAADQGTDERRGYEQRAVQAAQFARQAESVLEQEEQAKAQAEQAVEELTQEIEADQVRISELQEDLAAQRALAAQMPPPTDPPPPTPQALNQLEGEIQKLQLKTSKAKRTLSAASADLAASANRISAAMGAVQAARDKEIKSTNDSMDAQAKEDRLREDQFRREVAAAQEDPDTYVGGKPGSDDPVAQVSISVIGEGVIQLRGPLSGVNKIRQSINQIDQPVGQVRISIHTAQVNGEHGDRMEKVVSRIDSYIEHARFLTTHSTEMLRQSILQVASEKAMQAEAECPNGDQAARDEKYLYSFFGKDFIDELREMDSEFLKTGNKLLSLHSMDTTSLASALFVMALAKNDTRMEILATFNSKLECELPGNESTYHQAGYVPHFWGDGKNKMKKTLETGKNIEKRLMAFNAKFVNFAGFFNANVQGPDTLNPTQREFLKLAQIFKSRMITEIELRQRVVERGIIEQRDPDRVTRQDQDRVRSREAEEALRLAVKEREKQKGVIFNTLQAVANELLANDIAKNLFFNDPEKKAVVAAIDKVLGTKVETKTIKQWKSPELNTAIDNAVNETMDSADSKGVASETVKRILKGEELLEFSHAGEAFSIQLDLIGDKIVIVPRAGGNAEDCQKAWTKFFEEAKVAADVDARHLDQFVWTSSEQAELNKEKAFLKNIKSGDQNRVRKLAILTINYGIFGRLKKLKREEVKALTARYRHLLARLSDSDPQTVEKIQIDWLKLSSSVIAALNPKGAAHKMAVEAAEKVNQGFDALLAVESKALVAARIAKLDSFPLDHRRFLDFLIAETEDKYIELLEGTRSHTANIDNYIKRLITALDDDFNTQFYKPAFQGVRQASRLWDVNLAQIESTSILTNNRMFGKVSPQATMEFDLPKRDLLIQEALNGALASTQTYGALLNDPTFLSVVKLRSGQPTSSPSQRGGGESAVRNVLPGLPSATDEQIMGQAGPGNRELGSPLESLIPDPAIYKFESGTGFEVRPVIQPDGQAVVFHFNYMYRTNVREPIRADEKHLGRVKQHFIDTDVQLSNFELRKVSDYTVALKTSRTSRGVPLMEDIPGLGALFRPLPSAESSLQQNVVMAQATIFPTLFDLMGLRWAPAVADLDQIELQNENHTVRGRRGVISNKVYDFSSEQVDTFLQIEKENRRPDLYRSQKPISPYPPYPYNMEQTNPAAPVPAPDLPNDPQLLVPEPAAKQPVPQRQAARTRSGVLVLPPPADYDSPPARETRTAPRTQPRTAPQSRAPRATDQSGPVFAEPMPVPVPPDSSSSKRRQSIMRDLIQPAGGLQSAQSADSGVVTADLQTEDPTFVHRTSAVKSTAGKPVSVPQPALEAAGRARVERAPSAPAASRPSLLPWFKRKPQRLTP